MQLTYIFFFFLILDPGFQSIPVLTANPVRTHRLVIPSFLLLANHLQTGQSVESNAQHSTQNLIHHLIYKLDGVALLMTDPPPLSFNT